MLQLLEAYLLQGVPPEALAEKVLTCSSDLFKDASTGLVRSMLWGQAFAAQAEASDSPRSSTAGAQLQLEECSYEELCRKVTPDILAPCLLKLLETFTNLLASYHAMLTWHKAGLAEHTQAAAAAAAHAAARSPATSSGGAGGDIAAEQDAAADATASQEQLQQVQAATKGILAGVHAALQDSRVVTAEAAAVLVKELLAGAGGCSGSEFPQVCGHVFWREHKEGCVIATTCRLRSPCFCMMAKGLARQRFCALQDPRHSITIMTAVCILLPCVRCLCRSWPAACVLPPWQKHLQAGHSPHAMPSCTSWGPSSGAATSPTCSP